MRFSLTGLIKEVLTPTQPAFDVKEYTEARVKYGDAIATQMRKAGQFNIKK